MTDNCGWPTAEDTACQHPATEDNGRCWLHAEDAEDIGRPTKFTDDRAQAAIEAAGEPLSEAGIARAIGVPRTTLQSWLGQDLEYVDEDGERREFSAAFMRARHDPETLLVRGPLTRDDIDGQHARFLLSTSFGYKKTERREVEADVTTREAEPLDEDTKAAIRSGLADRRR